MTVRPSERALKAAAAVSEERLWARLMEMARYGARPDGGVCRQALTPEDRAARRVFVERARERGYAVSVDPAANLFVRRDGGGNRSAILTGSHMDSQPAGGRFDGIYGVLAGLEAIDAIGDAGIALPRPIEVEAWTNEEGGRFAPGAMGSMAWSGHTPLEAFHDVTDADGTRFVDALEETLAAEADLDRRPLGGRPHAYLEAHIEQGPVLERDGVDLAAVTGIQGWRWFRVEVTGRGAHAGTTPLAGRRDALQAAVRAIEALNRLMADPDDVVRFTVGRMVVEPNSPNTVPERVVFTIDFRHPDLDALTRLGDRIPEVVAGAVRPCEAEVVETTANPPNRFPETIVSLVEQCARALGHSVTRLPSGAFHDASFVASVCPTGMIFVPCRDGISHHPDEYAEPHHLAAGARTLTAALVTLAEGDD